MVKVNQSYEPTEFTCSHRARKLTNNIYFATEGADAMAADMMAEELQTTHAKKALGRIDDDAIIAKPLKHFPQMLFVFLFRGTGNEDIVNVHEAKMQSSENLVHETLECLTSVAQTERHAGKFKQAKRGSDGRFRNIVRLDGYLMVRSYQVKLGEDACAVEG